MPTTVTKTIGSTGDYPSLALWEAASPANLVTADQIWRGEMQNQEFVVAGTILTIAGQTTDATRYVELTTVAGASFADNANKLTNALRYNASNGAAMRASGAGYVDAFVVTTSYTRLSKFQLKDELGPPLAPLTLNGGNCTVDQVIAEGAADGILKSAGATNVVRNTLVVNTKNGSGAHGFVVTNNSCSLYNCSAIKPSNVTTSGQAFVAVYSTVSVKNCAGFGFTDFSGQFAATLTGNNNASDKTISFGTSNQASLTYADQIEQPNSGSGLDCRTKSGAALVANGVDLSSVGVTTDIVGTARGSNYDIGVWQRASGTIYSDTVTETLSLSFSVSAVMTMPASVTETMVLTHTVSAAFTAADTVTETLSSSFSVATAQSMVASTTEALSLSDAPSTTQTSVNSVTETLALSDTVSAVQASSHTVAETLALTFDPAPGVVISATVTEALSLSFSVDMQLFLAATASETLVFDFVATTSVTYTSTASEVLSLSFSASTQYIPVPTSAPTLMGAPRSGPLINVDFIVDMEEPNVDEVMEDSEFMAKFRVRRAKETVSDQGRASLSYTTFFANGSMQPATGTVYAIFPEMTRLTGDMEVFTKFRLTSVAKDYQGDLVDFEGQTYVVRGVTSWRGYGVGYQIALLGLYELVGPSPTRIGPPPGVAGVG